MRDAIRDKLQRDGFAVIDDFFGHDELVALRQVRPFLDLVSNQPHCFSFGPTCTFASCIQVPRCRKRCCLFRHLGRPLLCSKLVTSSDDGSRNARPSWSQPSRSWGAGTATDRRLRGSGACSRVDKTRWRCLATDPSSQ